MEKLRAQGINARELQESNSILHKDIAFGTKVKHQEFVIYCRQYATLIRVMFLSLKQPIFWVSKHGVNH